MPSVFCVQKRIYVVKNRLHRPEASPERRGEPPNGGGGVCRTHGRGFRTLRRAGMLPLRAAGAQEGRQPAVFHPLVNHPFSLGESGADCRHVTASIRGTAVGLPLRVFLRLFAVHRQCTATQTVSSAQARHNSAAQLVSALLQTGSTRINAAERLIRRCRPLQRAKELRNTVMLRLRRPSDMCSSNVSDPANRLRKTRKKKSSAVPLFRSGHMSVICARLGSKGKVGVQRGRETAGVPSFLPPAAGRGTFPPSAGGESPR